MSMIPLNLPEFNFQTKEDDGKTLIFDVIRKKYVVLTPEEWVRQNFIMYMIKVLEYPRALMKIESGLTYHRLKKRSDLIVHNRDGDPVVLVEFKSPEYNINQKTLEQISVYNQAIRASYLIVTNGLKHFCWHVDFTKKTFKFLNEIPSYEKL